MNNLRNFINGSEYVIKPISRTKFSIIHKPTQSYVDVVNHNNTRNMLGYVQISMGSTPNNNNKGVRYRGRGIGRELRALATLYAIYKRKIIKQSGTNVGGISAARVAAQKPGAKPYPTSTFLLRNILGWNKNNSSLFPWNSIFIPGRTNETKVRAIANAAKIRKTHEVNLK